jgi:hypothetical protein
VDINKFKKDILDAKQSKDIVLFKNLYPVVPIWDEFILNLNHEFNSQKTIDIDDQRFHNNVLIYNKLDPISFKKIDLTKNSSSNIFKKSYHVFNIMDNFINNISCVKSIINFVGNESKYYIHADHHDVISWHCIGQVEWRIYKTLEQEHPPPTETSEPYESYILSPGDVLFVPGGIVHQVVVTEPRASVLFNIYFKE